MSNQKKKLDKDEWVVYIQINQHRIGLLLDWKTAYNDLINCVNPDMDERAFMAAYEEVLLDGKS